MIANETLPEFILLACNFIQLIHECTCVCTLQNQNGCCGSEVSLGGEKT